MSCTTSPVLSGSWYNTGDVNEEVAEDLENGIRPPRSDAYTINGQPGDFYACSNSMYIGHTHQLFSIFNLKTAASAPPTVGSSGNSSLVHS